MISVEFRDWVNEKVLERLPSNKQRLGDKVVCRCPICGDSKKNSLKKRGYYYLATASYHCFNCGETLSGMKLLERLTGDDYADLRNEYVRMMYDGRHFRGASNGRGREAKKSPSILFGMKNVVKPEWKHALSEKATAYLSGRHVLEAPFLREKLYSYFTKKGDEYILIPWRMNGVDCYFQLNDFEKHNAKGMKYIFPKNKDKLIYGLDNVDASWPYIFCFEGVYDSLFIPNAVAIGGKNLTELQHKIIKKRFPNHRIVISLDNDIPGLTAVSKLLSSKETATEYSYLKWFGDDTREKDVNELVNAKGDVNLFVDRKRVEACVVDPVVMKMWLKRRGV